jgi:hypothetical protein
MNNPSNFSNQITTGLKLMHERMKLSISFGIMMSMFSFFLGCSSFGHQSPRYVKLADEITAKTAKKLEKEKKLHLIGTGGRMMDDIWGVTNCL